MPSLGMYTTEGTLTDWLKSPGSQVKAGDPIITIMTGKSTYEVEAPEDGVVHAVAQVGAVIADQGLLGYILAPGEAPPTTDAAAAPVSGAGTAGESSAPGGAGAQPRPENEGGTLEKRAGEAVQADAQGGVRPTATNPPAADSPTGGEVRASPVARRIAREKG